MPLGFAGARRTSLLDSSSTAQDGPLSGLRPFPVAVCRQQRRHPSQFSYRALLPVLCVPVADGDATENPLDGSQIEDLQDFTRHLGLVSR